MKTNALPSHTLLFTFQILSQFTLAQNGGKPLPQATYISDNQTWMVTVPTTWNFTTILEATGRGSIITDPEGTMDNFTTSNPYPNTDFTPYVYVNGSFSRYATNAMNYGIELDFNTSIAAYSDETWKLPVVCEWPISGMYSRLNRILYYVLLVFALVVHHYEWLVAGALASATIYSGSAAVQAWAQFGVINRSNPPDSAGDNDNEAIMGILAAGLLMAVPLINWSRTLRRLRTRPILIYWALIIFVGYLLVIIGEQQTAFSHGWTRHVRGVMTCDTRESLPTFKDLGFIDHNFISQYNCDDPCYTPQTHHPFHDSSSTISRITCDQFSWTDLTGTALACFIQCPREISDTCFVGHLGWSNKDYTVNNVGYYGVLPVAVFELFFVLCFGRKAPEDIRDTMFRFFVGSKLMKYYRGMSIEKRKLAPKIFRVRLAQSGALLFYFFAALTYLVCLPFFFFSIAWQERLMRFFPDAERYFEVGQWLPWVGIGLTLGAAVVAKYHHTWHVYILHYVFRQKKGMRKSRPVTKAKDKGYNLAGWVQRKTWRTRSRLWKEWRDLKDFILHPFHLVLDEVRERTSDHPTVKYSFAGNLPYPDEEERNSKDHYEGPWIKDDDTWKTFDVEFQVEADGRTLQSWERHQRHVVEDHEQQHIVYSIHLPPVPSYPDKRTVIANVNDSHIVEKVTVDHSPERKDTNVSEALVSGARKPSTVAYSLQALTEFSRNDSMDQESLKSSSSSIDEAQERTSLLQSPTSDTTLRPEERNPSPDPSSLSRNFTPSPGPNGGPLNSHHLPGDRNPSPDPQTSAPLPGPDLPSTKEEAEPGASSPLMKTPTPDH